MADFFTTPAKAARRKGTTAPVDANGTPVIQVQLSMADLHVLREALDEWAAPDEWAAVADSVFSQAADWEEWLEGRIEAGEYPPHPAHARVDDLRPSG